MRITVVPKISEMVDREGVITLIVEQLHFIGYSHTEIEVETLVTQALREESRSTLFVGYDETNCALAFAFGNMCSGLECSGDYFWLNELYVTQSHRREGLASEMLTYTQNWAKAHGCVYFALVTHPKNSNARHTYSQSGFEEEPLIWVDKYL